MKLEISKKIVFISNVGNTPAEFRIKYPHLSVYQD